MLNNLFSRLAVVIFVSLVCLLAFLTLSTDAGLVLAAKPSQPSDYPGPKNTVVAVIHSIAVNGWKSDPASSSDIELLRKGKSTPEETVSVGAELSEGDKIATKDKAQLVIRFPNGGEESTDLVYMDPDSQLVFEALESHHSRSKPESWVCAMSGRFLAWVGTRFRLCSNLAVIGVKGTEFDVSVKSTEVDVIVYEGELSVVPNYGTDATSKERLAKLLEALIASLAGQDKISAGKALKIEPDEKLKTTDLSRKEMEVEIDRWSDQMIKASRKRGGVSKAFVNYVRSYGFDQDGFLYEDDDVERVKAFKTARRSALLDHSDKSYFAMAQAFNDWDNGEAAQKSLSKVTNLKLRESALFMVNDAEAERLRGNLPQAEVKIQKALEKYPSYSPAYVVKGSIIQSKVRGNPAQSSPEREEARKSFIKALLLGSGSNQINKKMVEKTIKEMGARRP